MHEDKKVIKGRITKFPVLITKNLIYSYLLFLFFSLSDFFILDFVFIVF